MRITLTFLMCPLYEHNSEQCINIAIRATYGSGALALRGGAVIFMTPSDLAFAH